MKSNFNSASGLRPPPLPPEFSPESNWGEERFQVRLDVGRAAREEEIRVVGGAHEGRGRRQERWWRAKGAQSDCLR